MRSVMEYGAPVLFHRPCGAGNEIVCAPGLQPPQVLPAGTAGLIGRMRGCATIEAHAQALAGSENAEALASRLQSLASDGWLASPQSLVEAWERGDASAPRAQISEVAVVTRNRRPALLRCIESHARNAHRHGRSLTFRVFDDSADAAYRSDTKQSLRDLSAALQVPIAYAGEEEKAAYATLLATCAAVPRQVVEFALGGGTAAGPRYGANRNAILLDCAGARTGCVDDDTVCRPMRGWDARNAISFDGRTEPREYTFHKDLAGAWASLFDVEVDVWGEHERWLGSGPADWVRTPLRPDTWDFANLDPVFGRQLARGANRIRLTMNGLAGDSGMGNPARLLALSGVSRDNMLRTLSGATPVWTSRAVTRLPRGIAISTRSFCMTTFFGIDHATPLPPFFPSGASEDTLFGGLSLKSNRDWALACLPTALVHQPLEPRSFALEDLGRRSPRRITQTIALLLTRMPDPFATDPAQALRAIGEWLADAVDGRDFQGWLRDAALSQRGTARQEWTHLLAQFGGEQKVWADLVQAQISALDDLGWHGDDLLPEGLEGPDRLGQCRDLIRKYAGLLMHWPALFAAARQLRQGGAGLARHL